MSDEQNLAEYSRAKDALLSGIAEALEVLLVNSNCTETADCLQDDRDKFERACVKVESIR
jgi:hypothetical protein